MTKALQVSDPSGRQSGAQSQEAAQVAALSQLVFVLNLQLVELMLLSISLTVLVQNPSPMVLLSALPLHFLHAVSGLQGCLCVHSCAHVGPLMGSAMALQWHIKGNHVHAGYERHGHLRACLTAPAMLH